MEETGGLGIDCIIDEGGNFISVMIPSASDYAVLLGSIKINKKIVYYSCIKYFQQVKNMFSFRNKKSFK